MSNGFQDSAAIEVYRWVYAAALQVVCEARDNGRVFDATNVHDVLTVLARTMQAPGLPVQTSRHPRLVEQAVSDVICEQPPLW